jgi:hypothetical protein
MGYPIYTAQGLSTGAYTKTANLITGRNQFLGKGRLQVWAKGSAIGMNISIAIGGVAIMDDLPVPSIGTTGTLSTNDNAIIDQVVAGGVAELYFRNTTVGALTMDALVTFTPMK